MSAFKYRTGAYHTEGARVDQSFRERKTLSSGGFFKLEGPKKNGKKKKKKKKKKHPRGDAGRFP